MRKEIMVMASDRIDRKKWDTCINESPNGLIYAASDYLDHITDNWTGIVLNDYEAVMPVAWRKKYGITYAYDIPFIQQLGIYPANAGFPTDDILARLYSICSYGDYFFNYANTILNAAVQVNFIMPLNRSYEDLQSSFARDVRQNIKKAEGHDLAYIGGSVDEAVDVFKHLYGKMVHITDSQYQNFKAVCKLWTELNKVIVRKVVNTKKEVLAIVLLLKDNRRLYNIMNSTLPLGRLVEANYFLLSNVWKEFEKTDLIFDFEGSVIPGIQEFYMKFNAVRQPYYKLHINHLPWPLHLIKK